MHYDVLSIEFSLSVSIVASTQVGRMLSFILDKLLCMISCFTLITKQLVLCGEYKENLHVLTDKLAGAETV